MTAAKGRYENNWKSHTLEHLEKEYWGKPTYDSHLVKTCHELRQKPLKDFETEDLRIMIGQNIGLKYLLPLALEILKDNILAEGDFYEGDLLKSVLTCDREFWKSNSVHFIGLEALVSDNEQLLKDREPELWNTFTELVKRNNNY